MHLGKIDPLAAMTVTVRAHAHELSPAMSLGILEPDRAAAACAILDPPRACPRRCASRSIGRAKGCSRRSARRPRRRPDSARRLPLAAHGHEQVGQDAALALVEHRAELVVGHLSAA